MVRSPPTEFKTTVTPAPRGLTIAPSEDPAARHARERSELAMLNLIQADHNKLMAEGNRLRLQTLDPMERLAEKQARLNELMATGAIDATTWGKQMQMAAATAHNAYASALSNITGALSQVFESSKGFAIANAIINSYQAFTAALKNPPGPPFSYANAAAALAAGFAQVRAIMSTTAKSSGGGGSSAPAGGGGAADTAASPSQLLTVQGLDPNALISGASVRDLAERLLAFQRDGGQVVLA